MFYTFRSTRIQANNPYANYNLEAMYSNQGLVCHFLAWIVNALAKIFNDKDNNFHLPRYILIVLDKDLIQNAELADFEFTRTLEDTLSSGSS